jgi:hypothetical protein
MVKRGEIEGWAQTTQNPWLDRHYFRLGKVLPVCGAGVNNFIQVRLAPTTKEEFKCLRCSALLEKDQQRRASR